MISMLEMLMLRWRLREVMARKKMTNRELAQILGVHETSISRLKLSNTMPRIDGNTLERLCEALMCTPEDLLEYQPGVKKLPSN